MTTIKTITVFMLIIGLSACASTSNDPEILSTITQDGKTPLYQSDSEGDYFILSDYSDNPDYGLTPEYAIKVGGGPIGELTYMNSLRGPQGQSISFTRRGSCCPFEDETLYLDGGLLDVYEVYYEGTEEPILIFLNMYLEDQTLYIPKGLTAR